MRGGKCDASGALSLACVTRRPWPNLASMAMMMARGSALSNAMANLLRWNFCRQDTKMPNKTSECGECHASRAAFATFLVIAYANAMRRAQCRRRPRGSPARPASAASAATPGAGATNTCEPYPCPVAPVTPSTMVAYRAARGATAARDFISGSFSRPSGRIRLVCGSRAPITAGERRVPRGAIRQRVKDPGASRTLKHQEPWSGGRP